MHNLRNRNETVGFCSKGFSGSSSTLTCSVSSFLRQLLLPSTPKPQFSELLEWESFQIGVVCHIVEKLLIDLFYGNWEWLATVHGRIVLLYLKSLIKPFCFNTEKINIYFYSNHTCTTVKNIYIAQNGIQWKVSFLPISGPWADCLELTSNTTLMYTYQKFPNMYLCTHKHSHFF